MATYVVDKRTGNDANTGLSEAQAWKTLKAANGVPTGTHAVEIIEGSGPYIQSDLGRLGYTQFYPSQAAGSVITWNFNGNALALDINVNDGTRKWTQSTAKPGWYYLTELNGTVPKVLAWDNAPQTMQQVQTATIGVNWSCKSTNLNNPPYITPGQGFTLYGRYLTNNWYWGDLDTLGFSTLYVFLAGGVDPTDEDIDILVPGYVTGNTVIGEGATGALHLFNDAIFSGGNDTIIQPKFSFEFDRCEFRNVNNAVAAMYRATLTNNKFKFCKGIGCGHALAQIDTYGHNLDIYHCHTEDAHTVVKMLANAAYTVNYYNNTTRNLLAGVIQKDVATPTLNEDYNQHHIDPSTTHGNPAIAFTAGTRQWTTTGAHDFPASAATTGMGVDLVNEGGSLPNGLSRLVHGALVVSGINNTGQEDIAGNASGTYPNIGADQLNYAPGFGPWSTCGGILPLSAQPCKSHALPIGVGKLTVFPGIASSSQIEEAK